MDRASPLRGGVVSAHLGLSSNWSDLRDVNDANNANEVDAVIIQI